MKRLFFVRNEKVALMQYRRDFDILLRRHRSKVYTRCLGDLVTSKYSKTFL